MSDIEYNPIGWAKDSILTGEIAKILDSTEGSDYIYTISVQGHGDYPSQMPENSCLQNLPGLSRSSAAVCSFIP